MKNQLTLVLLVLSSLTIACNENKEYGNITEEGILEVEESTSINDKLHTGVDSSVRLSDGTELPVVFQSTDSIDLPEELLDVIKNINDIHPDSILVKRKFRENNITYYELEFKMKEGPNQTFTFDEEGKRKSND